MKRLIIRKGRVKIRTMTYNIKNLIMMTIIIKIIIGIKTIVIRTIITRIIKHYSNININNS